jgi:hypothetical protein
MAPRRLSAPYVLQIFPLFNSKLEKILATILREEQGQKRKWVHHGLDHFFEAIQQQ